VHLVHEAIEKLDYKPRRLRSGPRQMRNTQRQHKMLEAFALVVPETRAGFYPSLQYGFERASNEVDNQVIVCSTDNDMERQGNIILQLLDKGVVGVAIVPTAGRPTPPYQIRRLQQQGVPVVFCHRRVEGVQAPLLAIPFPEVGRLAGEALVEQGHRRVAYFAVHRSAASEAYEAGLREAIRGAGSDLPENLVYRGSHVSLDVARQEEAVLEALQRMFHSADRPTGIMASFDSMAELIYLLLGRLGLRVPEDVSLVSFGGAWREGAVRQQLTSVIVDETLIGRRAVELLHEMRSGDRPLDDNQQITMPLSLAAGRTLGPAPQQCRSLT